MSVFSKTCRNEIALLVFNEEYLSMYDLQRICISITKVPHYSELNITYLHCLEWEATELNYL